MTANRPQPQEVYEKESGRRLVKEVNQAGIVDEVIYALYKPFGTYGEAASTWVYVRTVCCKLRTWQRWARGASRLSGYGAIGREK